MASPGFHKDYNGAKEEQILRLPDGRTIGFAEYGDPEGQSLFAFHGCPGSRYDGWGWDGIGRKNGIRIICPDRPGHGLSSIHPGRKLSDYAKDISNLAGHLGIKEYHVFGGSGGGPYAIACAYASPKDELINAALIAGMGHPDVLTVKNAGWYTVGVLWIQWWFPSLFARLLRWSIARPERLKGQLEYAYKFLPEKDRKRMLHPQTQAYVMATMKAAYAQGPDGVIGDAHIYYGNWDFDLKDVMGKVFLFYGSNDNRTPAVFGRHYKEHLPNAELTELDETHFSIHIKDAEMFTKMLGRPIKPTNEDVEDMEESAVTNEQDMGDNAPTVSAITIEDNAGARDPIASKVATDERSDSRATR